MHTTVSSGKFSIWENVFEHWRSSQATSRFLRLSLMGLVMVHLMLMIISRMVGVKIDSAISRISLLLLRLDGALFLVVTWIETPFERIQNYPMVIVFPVFSITWIWHSQSTVGQGLFTAYIGNTKIIWTKSLWFRVKQDQVRFAPRLNDKRPMPCPFIIPKCHGQLVLTFASSAPNQSFVKLATRWLFSTKLYHQVAL